MENMENGAAGACLKTLLAVVEIRRRCKNMRLPAVRHEG